MKNLLGTRLKRERVGSQSKRKRCWERGLPKMILNSGTRTKKNFRKIMMKLRDKSLKIFCQILGSRTTVTSPAVTAKLTFKIILSIRRVKFIQHTCMEWTTQSFLIRKCIQMVLRCIPRDYHLKNHQWYREIKLIGRNWDKLQPLFKIRIMTMCIGWTRASTNLKIFLKTTWCKFSTRMGLKI